MDWNLITYWIYYDSTRDIFHYKFVSFDTWIFNNYQYRYCKDPRSVTKNLIGVAEEMTLQELLEKEIGPYQTWGGAKSLIEGNWRRLPFRLSMPLTTELSETEAAAILEGFNKTLQVYKISKHEVTGWSLLGEFSLAVNKK